MLTPMRNIAAGNIEDLESIETKEWLDSLDYVLQANGPARAGQLLQQLSEHARRRGIRLPFSANTPYINTLTLEQEVPFPGSQEIERRIKSLVRWNAIAMVVRANRVEPGIGGHISTFASAATLYEVGLQSFLQSQRSRWRPRRRVLPGTRGAGHLLARVPRRPSHREASREFQARACVPAAACRLTRIRG